MGLGLKLNAFCSTEQLKGRCDLHQDGILYSFMPVDFCDKCPLYYGYNYELTVVFQGVWKVLLYFPKYILVKKIYC